MADVSIEKTYAVGNRDVFLSLMIGEGQFGTSDVKLGDKLLVRASGPIGKLMIGKGADLPNKALKIRSVVNDISTQTNRMSVTYQLTGGDASEPVTAEGVCKQEGGLLIFEAVFTFTEA